MSNLSYGSITITDLTDLGQLSGQIMGNMPTTVIYDEDQENFNPDWSNTSTSLQLTPLILYGGSTLSGNSSGLTVTWKKKIGTNEATTIVPSSTVLINSTTKVLTIAENPFVAVNNVMPSFVTYILEVDYADASLGLTAQNALHAESRITFSLLKQVSSSKSCKITGESVFTFDQYRAIKGSQTITLTGEIKGTGLQIKGWYYKSGENWVIHPNYNSSSPNSLTISYNDSNIFENDKAVIKLQTVKNNEDDIYDLHNILRLYDGVPGNKNIIGTLTNDDQTIPADSSGTPLSGGLTEAYTRFQVLQGSSDITDEYEVRISSNPSYHNTNFKFSKSKDGSTWVNGNTNTTDYGYNWVKVTAMGNNVAVGSITFTAKKDFSDITEEAIVRTFSLTKIKTGLDGTSPVIYTLKCDAIAVNKTSGDEPSFKPSSIVATGYSRTGQTESILKGGSIVIKNAKGEVCYTASFDSSQNATYTIANSNPTLLSIGADGGFLIVQLKNASGDLLDKQTIVFTSDGQDGQEGGQGPKGDGAITVDIGNPHEGIPCTNNLITTAVSPNNKITIPFRAFQGSSKVACTLNTQNLGKIATSNSSDVTVSVTQPSQNNSYEGSIVYTIKNGSQLSATNGTIVLSFTVGTETITENFTWSANPSGKDGTNGKDAVVLRLYSPTGINTFVNDQPTTLQISGILTEGGSTVTNNITWQWKKYQSGTGYVSVTGNGNTITINKDSVNSYASYQCSATYNDNTYTEYFSVFDKSDPVQVQVMCSFGEQITNGQGIGALYVIVTRNGQEIDSIKTKVFSQSNPDAANGAYYYKLDSTNKTVKLMKKQNDEWTDVTDTETYTGKYGWSFRDLNGDPLTVSWAVDTQAGTDAVLHKQKVVYIEGSYINKKIIADVEVTI